MNGPEIGVEQAKKLSEIGKKHSDLLDWLMGHLMKLGIAEKDDDLDGDALAVFMQNYMFARLEGADEDISRLYGIGIFYAAKAEADAQGSS